MKKINLKNNRILQLVIVIIVLIGAIVGIKYLIYLSSDEYKFIKIGYTKEQYKIIKEKIEEKDITDFLNREYNPNLTNILNQKYFIYSNINKYIDYVKNKPDNDITDSISVVNAKADSDFYSNIEQTDTSKGNLILVNKYNQLDKSFVPENLVDVSNWYTYGTNKIEKEVLDNFVDMFYDIQKDGLKIVMNSGYRSYEKQEELYNYYSNSKGKSWADSIAARPGHSEHETGLAIDVTSPGTTDIDLFDQTEEFAWLQKNAYKYGFILRYPKGMEHITGYSYESWHYRYVGKEVAEKIHNLNITFDEYYAFYVKG